MKRNIVFGVLFFFLFLLPLVSAYQINQSITINVKLQVDNGTALQDVLVPACIDSIYYDGNNSFVVHDAPLTPGTYHSMVWTPTAEGSYELSVQCTVSNETAKYYETIPITPVLIGGSSSSGGAVLNLNAKILPSASSFVVNLGQNSDLQFPVQYFSNGVLTNSHEATWSITQNNTVLNSGQFVITSTGNYLFDYDFKNYVAGDYTVYLYFDGRNQAVTVHVISVNGDLLSVTGWVLDSSTGQVSPFKAAFALLFLFLIIAVIILAVRRRRSRRQ